MSMGGTGQPADIKTIRARAEQWASPEKNWHPDHRPVVEASRDVLVVLAALDAVAAELETAREERDLFYDRLAATREALERYAKHRYGCAAINTAGGLFRPGPCDCGLADELGMRD